MLTQKIKSVSAALGEMAGAVTEDQWTRIRRIRAELDEAADIAHSYEHHLLAPGSEQTARGADKRGSHG